MKKIILVVLLSVVTTKVTARSIEFDYIEVIGPHTEAFHIVSLDVNDKNELHGVLSDIITSCPDCGGSESLVSISKEYNGVRIKWLDVYGNLTGAKMAINNKKLFDILTSLEGPVLASKH